jgi:hypothetical protein
MRPRRMIFGTLRIVLQAFILMAVVGWFVVGGIPGLVLIYKKDDIVSSWERSGFDVGECKRRKMSLKDPTAGVPMCFESTFDDLSKRVEDGESGPVWDRDEAEQD